MTERGLVLVSFFAALIAGLGLLPNLTLISGVPVSAQSLGVMLCGTVLGARRGALAVMLFLLMVAIGLPVLSGGRGGLGVFVSPTAGFLLGFVPAAFVIGAISERLRIGPVWLSSGFAAVIGGIGVLYICGAIGLMVVLDVAPLQAVMFTLPFLPGDFVKAVIAGWLTFVIWKSRPEFVAGHDRS